MLHTAIPQIIHDTLILNTFAPQGENYNGLKIAYDLLFIKDHKIVEMLEKQFEKHARSKTSTEIKTDLIYLQWVDILTRHKQLL